MIVALCARIILTNRNHHDTVRPAELGAVLILIILSACNFATGTVALIQGAEQVNDYLNLYSKINFLSKPISLVGFGLFTIIILHDDLMAKMKRLEGILPICSYYKNIRDDEGSWEQMEAYISSHSDTKFSHGVCPSCRKKVMEEFKLNNSK